MDKFNIHNNQLDFSKLEEFFSQKGILKCYKKKEYFTQQNKKTNIIGFVKAGIFRLTHTNQNAEEHIIGYAFEGDFVSDYPALAQQSNSLVDIQATTECWVYTLTFQELNQFWETNMETQRLGRQIAELMFAEIYHRLISFYSYTPEERYIALMKRCPDLKEKITLKEIASFIGVTPETVSHIRKKLLQDSKS